MKHIKHVFQIPSSSPTWLFILVSLKSLWALIFFDLWPIYTTLLRNNLRISNSLWLQTRLTQPAVLCMSSYKTNSTALKQCEGPTVLARACHLQYLTAFNINFKVLWGGELARPLCFAGSWPAQKFQGQWQPPSALSSTDQSPPLPFPAQGKKPMNSEGQHSQITFPLTCHSVLAAELFLEWLFFSTLCYIFMHNNAIWFWIKKHKWQRLWFLGKGFMPYLIIHCYIRYFVKCVLFESLLKREATLNLKIPSPIPFPYIF